MHCKAGCFINRTQPIYHGWIALVLRVGSKPVPIVAKDLPAGSPHGRKARGEFEGAFDHVPIRDNRGILPRHNAKKTETVSAGRRSGAANVTFRTLIDIQLALD